MKVVVCRFMVCHTQHGRQKILLVSMAISAPNEQEEILPFKAMMNLDRPTPYCHHCFER
jgi:hypothetical protein